MAVPTREINTYLASHVFAEFDRVNRQLPLTRDTEEFARATLGRNMPDGQSLYEALLEEVLGEASPWFDFYEGSWKQVKNYGNGEMVRWYADQWAEKIGAVEANIKEMGNEANPGSLIGRITDYLDTKVVPDLERGPIFASGLLSPANGWNLLNVIDGLLKENEWRLHAAEQNRKGEYEAAKAEFEERSGLFRGPKLFAAYNGACEAHHEALLWLGGRNRHDEEVMGVYDRIEGLLRRLRGQVKHANAERYGKLAHITWNLSETFRLNRDALAAGMDVDDSDFVKMIMTVGDLQPALDAQIAALNIPDTLSEFMRMMLHSQDEWSSEEEAKIAKLVTDFFVGKVFADYASHTIGSFLSDKYGTNNPQVIAQNAYQEWMLPLATNQTRVLFPLDSNVMQAQDLRKDVRMIVPARSAVLQNAAGQLAGNVQVHASNQDRVLLFVEACVPLGAYADPGCCEVYYRSRAWNQPGRHLYEDREGMLDMPFGNWSKLPPVAPMSCVDLEALHYGRELDETVDLKEASSLFMLARIHGVIDDDGQIYDARRQRVEGAKLEAAGNPACRELILLDLFIKAPVFRDLVARCLFEVMQGQPGAPAEEGDGHGRQ